MYVSLVLTEAGMICLYAGLVEPDIFTALSQRDDINPRSQMR